MNKKQEKKVKKWLNTKVKQTRLNSLSLILLGLIFGCIVGYSLNDCDYSSTCRWENQEIGKLKAENIVCLGGFIKGIQAVILNHFDIVVWGLCIGWVLHGVGFTIIGRLN